MHEINQVLMGARGGIMDEINQVVMGARGVSWIKLTR